MLSSLPPATALSTRRRTAPAGRRTVRGAVACFVLGSVLIVGWTDAARANSALPAKTTSQKSSQKSSDKKPSQSKAATAAAAAAAATAAGAVAGAAAAKPPAQPAVPAGPVLQFGLFPRDSDAWWAWQTMQRRQPELVQGLNATVTQLGGRGGDGVALRATVGKGTDAGALCRRIVGAGFGCLVIDAGPAGQPADKLQTARAAEPAKPADGRGQDGKAQDGKQAIMAQPPSPNGLPAPGAPITTPEMAAAVLAKVTASPLAASPLPASSQSNAPSQPAVPAQTAAAGPAPIGATPAVSAGPTVTTVQTAAATTLALAVPRPPLPNEAAPPPDGTVNYSEEDARTMADIEQSSRSRGRLRAVVPDTRVDVMPATLKRESWNLCALTFDDGPHRTVTRQLLEVLNKEGVRATYFPVARVAQNQGDLIRDFLAAGHEIGNHSLTHSDLRAMNAEGQRYEIAEANRILRGFGANPVLFRPPYGRYNSDMLGVARDEQMSPVLWTVDTRDWKVRDADKIVQHIKSGAGTGSVLLMHSTYPSTVAAVPRVIAEMRAKGCEFVTLSEWLERMRLLAAPKIVNANMPVPPDPGAAVGPTPASATARN